MTNPVSNDKIPTPYPSRGQAGDKPSATRTSAEGNGQRPDSAIGGAELERASARYAQGLDPGLDGEARIATAEQARVQAARLREAMAAAPQAALRAHGAVKQTSVESVLRFP